ncbi:hypothetical protein JW905_18145 [bacterium]|nr:hypothetical protein [candidate division CSSED10-310 bacterium]
MNETNGIAAVLFQVRQPGLIGAAARAAKNMGIQHLRLVNPPPHFMNAAAAMAHGALDLLDSAELYTDLHLAVADAGMVLAVFMDTDDTHANTITPAEAGRFLTDLQDNAKVALVFGERLAELDTQELNLINAHVVLPRIADSYVDISIEQAVLLLGYETFIARRPTSSKPILQMAAPDLTERFFTQFQHLLEAVEFIVGGDPEYRMLHIRQLFGRAGMTDYDVGMWMGICRKIQTALKPVTDTPGIGDDQ